EQLADLRKERADVDKALATTLVSEAGPPRMVRVLARGNWLDEKGKLVEPGVPAILGKLDVKGRATRLDLARWMFHPEHPLTSRVFVNRMWRLFFGQGLVATLDDFGAQGTPPTHPELLDWLAVEFRESGWDVKHLIRLMVTSATYRQSSAMTEELLRRD